MTRIPDRPWWPEACAARRSGAAVAAIARRWKCDPTTLSRELAAAGVVAPPRRPVRSVFTRKPWWPDAVRAYSAGEHHIDIAARYRVNAIRLLAALRRPAPAAPAPAARPLVDGRIRYQSWWPEACAARVSGERVRVIAERHGVQARCLWRAFRAVGIAAETPLDALPWWQGAVDAARAGASLKALAEANKCTPGALREALALYGVEVNP